MLSLWKNRPHEKKLQDPEARRRQELVQENDKNIVATTCTSDNEVTLLSRPNLGNRDRR